MANASFAASTVRSRPVFIGLAIFLILALSFIGLGTPVARDIQGSTPVASSRVRHEEKSVGNRVHSPQRDLLLYAYFETEDAKRNLEFFVAHGLHAKMDFLFIINGDKFTVDIPKAANIKVMHRPNTCFDLGTFGEVIRADDSALRQKYDRFILMNSSVRGPFLPAWSRVLKSCWSDIFLNSLNDATKIAGITANCDPGYRKHLQSMILSVDRIGLDLILPGLQCADNIWDAVIFGETSLTMMVREAGFDAEVLYSQRHKTKTKDAAQFWDECSNHDIFFAGLNDGMDVHPFDTIFVKTKRTGGDGSLIPAYSEEGKLVVDTLTQWADASEYSSYDYC